jgi:hypothetical protein
MLLFFGEKEKEKKEILARALFFIFVALSL